MNQKIIGGVVGVIILASLGWFVFGRKSEAPKVQPELESKNSVLDAASERQNPVPSGRVVTIPLSAQNNSGESGQAILTEEGEKLKVVIELSGAPVGVVQPAHIHTGSCATIGGVKYALNFPRDGKSETTLDVSLDELFTQLPLAINVHKSGSEANIYFSCGDIVRPVSGVSSGQLVPSGQGMTSPSSSVDNRSSDGGPFATPTDKRKGADKPED